MYVILEGPDGAGKSTLAEKLSADLRCQLIHHGPYKEAGPRDLAAKFMASQRGALGGESLVLDRCWLSEPIYAKHYRQSVSRIWPEHQRMLERAALKARAVVVLCLPALKTALQAFLSGREEMMQSADQLRRVYGGYLDEFKTELPVITYDWENNSYENLYHLLNRARSPAPRVVLLSDRANVRTHAQDIFQVPFVSFIGTGCSEWLSRQLDEAEIPEKYLMWLNAYSSSGDPLEASTLPAGVPVFALGRNASKWCVDNQIAHRYFNHPQAHKRFASHEPYALIKELQRVVSR